MVGIRVRVTLTLKVVVNKEFPSGNNCFGRRCTAMEAQSLIRARFRVRVRGTKRGTKRGTISVRVGFGLLLKRCTHGLGLGLGLGLGGGYFLRPHTPLATVRLAK